MYFGAALHTPRGGQCPSLLRLKEGAEGRDGWRELGGGGGRGGRGRFAVEREAGRRRVQARSGKNEQTSSERWRGRAAEERPGVHSLFSPFFFSYSPLSLLSFSSLSLFSFLPSLSFSLSLFDRHSFSTISQFRFTLHRRLHRRASYSSNDFLLMSKYETQPQEVFFLFPFLPLFLSFSARFISRTRTSIIRTF